jgi:hypothetical protein
MKFVPLGFISLSTFDYGVVHLRIKDSILLVAYKDSDRLTAEFTSQYQISEFTWDKLSASELDLIKHHVLSLLRVHGLVNNAPAVVSNISGMEAKVICPIRRCEDELISIIILLNDSHKWTLKQIADWLDTLDDQPIFKEMIDVSIKPSSRVDTLL